MRETWWTWRRTAKSSRRCPEGSPAFEAEAPPRTGTVLRLVPEESPAQRRARRTGRRLCRAALALDFCASAAIVVLTVSAVIGFLHL